LQEIILYDQHIEASAISRLISAGLLLIPDGLDLPGLPAKDDSVDQAMDPFLRFLIEVMSTAIKDRESAAARVPIVIRGDKEDLDGIKQVSFDTPFDDRVEALRVAAINRLAIAVDLPPELLQGLGRTQHWTGVLVTQEWAHNYLPPLMAMVCGSLTTGWFHKALAAAGVDDRDELIMWFDSSAVRVQENAGPEVQWAWENFIVGDETVRRVFGYSDSDVPSDEEKKRQLLISLVTQSPVLAPLVFPLLGITMTDEQLIAADKIAQALNHSLVIPGAYDPGAGQGAVTQPGQVGPAQNGVGPTGTEQHPPGTPNGTVGVPTEKGARQPTALTRSAPEVKPTSGVPQAAPALAR
jgi:hypothetical protein